MTEYSRSTVTKVIETFRLAGPVRDVPFSRGDRTYRVDGVTIEWWRKDNGIWFPQSPRLHGAVLRKDGSNSKNRATETTWPKATLEDEWLTALIGLTTPADQVSSPAQTGDAQ